MVVTNQILDPERQPNTGKNGGVLGRSLDVIGEGFTNEILEILFLVVVGVRGVFVGGSNRLLGGGGRGVGFVNGVFILR